MYIRISGELSKCSYVALIADLMDLVVSGISSHCYLAIYGLVPMNITFDNCPNHTIEH